MTCGVPILNQACDLAFRADRGRVGDLGRRKLRSGFRVGEPTRLELPHGGKVERRARDRLVHVERHQRVGLPGCGTGDDPPAPGPVTNVRSSSSWLVGRLGWYWTMR